MVLTKDRLFFSRVLGCAGVLQQQVCWDSAFLTKPAAALFISLDGVEMSFHTYLK